MGYCARCPNWAPGRARTAINIAIVVAGTAQLAFAVGGAHVWAPLLCSPFVLVGLSGLPRPLMQFTSPVQRVDFRSEGTHPTAGGLRELPPTPRLACDALRPADEVRIA